MADADRDVHLMLGEMKGQLREVIHQNNNMSMKIDALAREVATNSTLPAQLTEALSRVAILEKQENRRAGAMSFGEWLMRSNLIIYLVMIAGLVWAAVTGKFTGH